MFTLILHFTVGNESGQGAQTCDLSRNKLQTEGMLCDDAD